MMRNAEMIWNGDYTEEARLYAVERCLRLMEKIVEDFEDLMITYGQLSMNVGHEVCSKMQMLQEYEEDEDDAEIGAVVVFPTGSVFEYSLSAVMNDDSLEDQVIDHLGASELLLGYAEQDVVLVDGKRYLDGAMVIFKADPEGEVLPLEDEELHGARIEAMRMIRRIELEGIRSNMFALNSREEA